MEITIIKCTSQEEINTNILLQELLDRTLLNISTVVEQSGDSLLRYIANPHANYSNVNYQKIYYECFFIGKTEEEHKEELNNLLTNTQLKQYSHLVDSEHVSTQEKIKLLKSFIKESDN